MGFPLERGGEGFEGHAARGETPTVGLEPRRIFIASFHHDFSSQLLTLFKLKV